MRARAAVIVGALLAGGAVVIAAGIDTSATVTTSAERVVRPVGDIAVVFDVGDVDRFVVDAAGRAAERAGGASTVGRTGSLGMQRLTRGGATVHAPPSGYLIPMVYTALPRGSIGRVIGQDIPPLLDSGSVVMNEMTAGLTSAAAGDVIVMQAANGSAVPLTVTAIRPYDQLGGADLVFTYDVANRLGATADTRAVIYDVGDRAVLEKALRDVGLIGRKDTKVNRSWDPPDPDDTLSTVRTKVALGEPWYGFASNGSVVMHPTWKATNLTSERVLLNNTIRVRAQCHVKVVDDLKAALAEVAAAGLGSAIDVGNTNTYGGCYVPRFSVTSGQIGFLSRHTYGMAIDMNTITNCGGCRPPMNCDVVRIFRKHRFAWGGNFRRPDGMHFEWVGEPRDQIAFPSTYCPNIVSGAALTESSTPVPEIGRGALLAGDSGMAHEDPDAP
jgi:D-alanyl-D-alanine carboxypeptidase